MTGSVASWLPIYQPNLYSTRFSLKGSLEYKYDNDWRAVGSIGMANRFPTVRELYTLATVGVNGVATNPNPNLRPELALSKELMIERKLGTDGAARISFFDEEVRDAIINQLVSVPAAPAQLVQTPTNVQRIRNSGIEEAFQKDNFYFKGLEVLGSGTWLNARSSLIRPGRRAFRISSSPGRPPWPARLCRTFPNGAERSLSHIVQTTTGRSPSLAGIRASYGAPWRTTTAPMGSISPSILSSSWTPRSITNGTIDSHADFGVDNIGNYRYFLFHPFPQRTFYVAGRYQFGETKGEPGLFYTGNEGGWPDVGAWFQPVAWNFE